MNIKQELAKSKEMINAKIREVIKNKQNKYNQIHPQINRIWDVALPNALGGKKIRGALAIHTYKFFDGDNEGLALDLAVIIELIHAFILMHDDFMDKDSLRRGYQTIHDFYREDYDEMFTSHKSIHKQHFGNVMAVLIGDIINFFAFELISELDLPKENIRKNIFKEITDHLILTGYGQVMDTYFGERRIDQFDESDVLNIHHYKTSVYTYENPMKLGALLAGVDSEESLNKLNNFAHPAGLTFQIQDDVLGVFGNSEKTGKPITSDMNEGKKTLLVSYTLKNGNNEQIDYLKEWWGNPNASKVELSKVKQIFKESGALDYSKDFARKKIKKAKSNLINDFPNREGEGKDFLIALADYMLTRKM